MITRRSRISIALTAALLAWQPAGAIAQGGAAVRIAVDVARSISARGGAEAAGVSARELTAFGGTAAIREVLEQAGREGGEELMQTVARHAGRHGILALQAARGAPAAVIRALDDVPPELVERSLRAIVREPAAMHALVRDFGATALESAARHPGLTAPIGRSLGAEGLDLSRRLATDEAVLLSRHADDIARLPAAERSQLLAWIRQSPAKTLTWIEKHPRLLLAGSATAVITAARHEIFGDGESTGLLERAAAGLYRTFEKPVNAGLGIVAAAAAGWVIWKLRGLRRFSRRRA